MNKNIVGKIRNIRKDGELKGTCFLINSTYVLTAAHVLEDTDEIKDLDIIFKFVNVVTKIKDIVYLDEDNIDFVILSLENNIDKDIDYSEIYMTIALEKGDVWETIGYPEDIKHDLSNIDNKYSYVDGNIIREIEDEKCDYELSINDQKDNTDWKGLSGSPLIVDEKIVGIISVQVKSRLTKTKIKAISMQKIAEFLLEKDRTDILELFSYKTKNLLNDRIDALNEKCEESFFYFKYDTDKFTSDCLVLKKNYGIKDVGNLVNLFLVDYANQLKELILLEDENFVVRRKQKQIVDEIAYEMREELIKDRKISLVLLWIILEGKYKSPRLASTYSLLNNNLKQDIYISKVNNEIKLLIGYAEMQENLLDSIKESLKEISQQNIEEKKQSRVVIWDEVAVNSLDISTKLQIEKIKNKKIKLEIILLHSYNSEIYTNRQYMINGENEQVVQAVMRKELNDKNNDIAEVCSQFNWIEDIKINWISLPIESLDDFINSIK